MSNTPGKCSDEIPVLTCSTKKISAAASIAAALDRGIKISVNNFLGKRSSGSENSKEEFPMKKHAKISCGDESRMVRLSVENLEEYNLSLPKQAVIFEKEIGSIHSRTHVTQEELYFILKMHCKKKSEYGPKKVIECENEDAAQQALDAAQQALFLLIRAKRWIFSHSKIETEFREGVSNNEDVMREELGVANMLEDTRRIHENLQYIEVPADTEDIEKKAHKILFVDEYMNSGKTAGLLSEICKDMWLVVRCVYIISTRDSSDFDKIDYNGNIDDEKIVNIGAYMRSYMDIYLLRSVNFRAVIVQSTSTFLYNLFEKFNFLVKDCVHSTARKNLQITFMLIKECYKSLPSNVALICFLASLKTHDVSYDLRQMAYFVVIPEDMENLVVAQDASVDIQKSITFIEEELEKFSLLLKKNTENVPTSPGYDPS